MDIIKNNPYRIIGTLVGTSTREEHTKTKKLKMYIGAQQEVPEDFSFPIIGSLNRNIENVEDAISKLNLNNDRVNASLFWFYNGNAITDEPMFDALKASKEEAKEAIDVWIKLAAAEEVTKRNASAFQNLSTYYLNSAFKKATISKNNLEKGITLKLKFLDSDFINDFIKLSSDETYKVSKEGLQIYFLTQVYNEIEKVDKNFVDWYLGCISKISFSAKQNYLNDFVSKPIEHIKTRIEETKARRKENPSKGYDLGLSLFENENEKINTIQNVLGKSNIQFTSISDKLSDEILQCGIVYFKKYRDTDVDPSAKAMYLFKKSKKLAIGSIAVQRCQENTENLQEWIDGKTERERQNLIEEDLQFITSKIEKFQDLSDTVANAKNLVDSCKPRLNNIKSTLGIYDDLYINISSAVVRNAQGMLVTAVNEEQEKFSNFRNISSLKSTINDAYSVIISLSAMDMSPNLRIQFNKNKEVIKSIQNQIFNATASTAESLGRSAGEIARRVTTGKNSSGGCYIATMAYGDYEHPQVKFLREFRDDILDKYIFGRYFIKTYYKYSPKLVEKLKGKENINFFIRITLNQIIKIIK